MEKTVLKRDRGQIPFSSHSLDLTGLDGEDFTDDLILNGKRITIQVTGQLFSLMNNLVPVFPLGLFDPLGLPKIRFNDLNATRIDLTPFAVYKLDYDKVIIDVINQNISNSFPRTYSTKGVFVSSGIQGVDLNNFRRKGRFVVGRAGSTAFAANTQISLTFPVPVGAANTLLQTTFTVTAADMLVEFFGMSGNQVTLLASATHALATQIVDLAFDCRLYDNVRIRMTSAVGYAGALTEYKGEFV